MSYDDQARAEYNAREARLYHERTLAYLDNKYRQEREEAENARYDNSPVQCNSLLPDSVCGIDVKFWFHVNAVMTMIAIACGILISVLSNSPTVIDLAIGFAVVITILVIAYIWYWIFLKKRF